MYSFPNIKTVCCSMSGSNCCFLTCIQFSQEAGQVVWYSHLFKNFPHFVMIHTVKRFSIVSEVEGHVILKFPSFFYDPVMLAIWSLVPLFFLNPSCTSGSFWFTYCWNLAWRILNITLLACEIYIKNVPSSSPVRTLKSQWLLNNHQQEDVGTHQKKIPQVQGQKSHNEMVREPQSG